MFANLMRVRPRAREERALASKRKQLTFARMASSRGVVDDEAMVDSCLPTVEKPRAYRRNMVLLRWRGGGLESVMPGPF